MADNEPIKNGINADSTEFSDGPSKKVDSSANRENGNGAADRLSRKLEALEREERDLVSESVESAERIRELREDVERLEREKAAVTSELDEMKTAEIERSELERRAMESITKRAFELEGEVVRLQHDLVSAMNGGEEASRQVEELRIEIDVLKSEKASLSAQLTSQIDELKRLRSDSEARIEEMEKKVEGLKIRESEAKREKSEVEERARVKLEETEKAISQLKKEKEDVEDTMVALEVELKLSEEKVKKMEEKVTLLVKKSEESEVSIAGLMEKAAQRGVDGFFVQAAEERKRGLEEEMKKKGKTMQFPVVAAGAVSTGVVVAAALAVCYVRYSRTN